MYHTSAAAAGRGSATGGSPPTGTAHLQGLDPTRRRGTSGLRPHDPAQRSRDTRDRGSTGTMGVVDHTGRDHTSSGGGRGLLPEYAQHRGGSTPVDEGTEEQEQLLTRIRVYGRGTHNYCLCHWGDGGGGGGRGG